MSRLVASQRAWLAPAWVREDLSRKAQALPSLDLRFAESKSLTDAVSGQSLVTFTRASSGTYVGSDGLLKTAANDAPRFDHNPTTGESLGLLVEEQRTNSIRNNTMGGAVAGTPGTLPTNWGETLAGLTREVVAAGTQAGISYIDLRLSGTTSSTQAQIRFEANNQVAALVSQNWTNSFYCSVVSGSTANITTLRSRITERDAAVGYLSEGSTAFVPTATLTRYSHTRTLVSTTTAFVVPDLMITFSSGVAIDITLRIGMPQLEQGAFATSVIPTSGTAATRSADLASITGANFSSWYNSPASTIYSEAQSSSGAAYTGYGYTIGSDFNNSITHYRQIDFQPVARIRNAGVDEYGANGNGAIWTGTSLNKFALAISAASGRQASNGSLDTAGDDTSIAAPSVSSMTIGALAGPSIFLNGTIRRLTYWPIRLGNNVLQAITQ